MHRPARRRFIAALGSTACLAPWLPARAAALPRVLSLDHLHTGEKLTLAYHEGGHYLPDALAAVDHLLRDFRSGAVGRIDTALLDLLHALRERTGSRAAFQVVSAFRSPATNEMLRRHGGGGVARGSLHLHGQAIDVRLADVALPQLRDAALSLRGGGVGFYAASNFVHLDTGRPRTW